MKTKTMKIAISLPDNLLKNFDENVVKKGYSYRSEALQDAIRYYISSYEWMCGLNGRQIGAISVSYDRTKRGLSDALEDILHHYSHVIKFSMHIHADQKNNYKIVVLEANAEEVIELAEDIMTLKGVEYSSIATVAAKQKI